MLGFARKTEASPAERFPAIDEHGESNIRGLFVVGDLTGMPLLKNAINHGYDVVAHIDDRYDRQRGEAEYDVLIIGAGAAGLSAALECQQRGLHYLVLEKERTANTIANFPAGKHIYAEPVSLETRGDLWLGEAQKEEFVERWRRTVEENRLQIRERTPVKDIHRDKIFTVETETGETFTSQFIILAIGKQGNPRKLNVPGEDLDKVRHRLFDPDDYRDQDILIVGGGDSAIETALALAPHNRVIISYRRDEFARIKPGNATLIQQAMDRGQVRALFKSNVKAIAPDHVVIDVDGEEMIAANDTVFTMIGTQLPVEFFRRLGLRMENEWDSRRWVKLAAWSALVFTIYSLKKFKHGLVCHIEGCPFHTEYFSVASVVSEYWERAYDTAKYWYPSIYSALVLGFGLYYIFRRKPSRYTLWRTISVIGFQCILFFLLPTLLNDGNIYRLGYAWPLSMSAVFKPHHAKLLTPQFWWLWGLVFAFVGIPVLTYFHGKRYCSWLCGCGAMAETAGDPFRRLAPKGERAEKWERMIYIVLAAAVIVTLGRALWHWKTPVKLYDLYVMWALSGWVAIAAYPFFGSRIWCRYWCPLAGYMNLIGKVASRFQIGAVKGKCIDCGLCNMNCEMGIDIKRRALRGQPVTLEDTPCIGCGECVRVCPMDVLYVGRKRDAEARWQLPTNVDIVGIE